MKWKKFTNEYPPEKVDVLVFIPTGSQKKLVGRWFLNANKSITWVIANQFGFDFEPRTHWTYLPDDPV